MNNFVSCLLLIIFSVWCAESYPCSMDEFLILCKKNKENAHSSLQPELTHSLTINDRKSLRTFYNLNPRFLSAINKISISISNATTNDTIRFENFFNNHHSAFTNLRVFICSGLALTDDFAHTLTRIKGLTQIDLISADLSNNGFTKLISANLVHINVMNNPRINNKIIPEILRLDKRRLANLILIFAGTSVDNDYAQEKLKDILLLY